MGFNLISRPDFVTKRRQRNCAVPCSCRTDHLNRGSLTTDLVNRALTDNLPSARPGGRVRIPCQMEMRELVVLLCMKWYGRVNHAEKERLDM